MFFYLFMKVGSELEHTDFYQTVGANIRIFRKLHNLTQGELARRVNKSLACISKYEKGEVSIDLAMIYDIAEALSISPKMLMPAEEQFTPNGILFDMLPSIFKHRYVYVQFYLGERKEIIICCLEIQHSNGHVVLYVDQENLHDYKSCRYLMTGEISCCETNVVVYCTNPHIHGDFMFLCFNRLNLVQNKNIGLCTTVSPSYQFRSLKCALSESPIASSEALKTELMISKDELSYIRKNHSLLL